MTELVNFMLKAAGCDVQVTVDDINDFDNAAGRLRDIQDEYQAVCTLEPGHSVTKANIW
jgi:cohesin complex subunit SA-1/2